MAGHLPVKHCYSKDFGFNFLKNVTIQLPEPSWNLPKNKKNTKKTRQNLISNRCQEHSMGGLFRHPKGISSASTASRDFLGTPFWVRKHRVFLERFWGREKRSDLSIYVNTYIPRTQMTLVLVGKDLVLGGWPSKIEVIWVPGICKYIYIYTVYMLLYPYFFQESRKMYLSVFLFQDSGFWHIMIKHEWRNVLKYGWKSKNRGGSPKWMVKIMENPIKMDDLGGFPPLFSETPQYSSVLHFGRRIFDFWILLESKIQDSQPIYLYLLEESRAPCNHKNALLFSQGKTPFKNTAPRPPRRLRPHR